MLPLWLASRMPRSARARPRGRGVAGVAAVVLGAGIGELIAAVVAPASSPFSVVGGVLIDLAPAWAKDAAIALFGTTDKIALLVGIALVLLAAAARRRSARAAAPAGSGSSSCAALGVVGRHPRDDARRRRRTRRGFPRSRRARRPPSRCGCSRRLARRRRAGGGCRDPQAADPSDESRRRFLVWTGVAAAVGCLAAIGGTALRAASRTVEAVRSALTLPTPAVAAAPVPAGAELDIPGSRPSSRRTRSFYRIDTALIVPQVDPATWSLRIHGIVEEEVVLTWDELLALPLEESWTTLACVSNPVGGDLIGNAKWLGYPIRELLARARPKADADMVLSRSIDGFTASTPLEVLTEDGRNAILAVGMNGEPLPAEHGFPVRMVVPGLYGYVSATKWVTELEVTRFDQATAYWTDSRLVGGGSGQAAVAHRRPACATRG